MNSNEKSKLINDVLHDARVNGGDLDALFTKYQVTDTQLQSDIRSRWSQMQHDKEVQAARERENHRAACGYASDPNDQALIEAANKEVADLINEGTKDLAGGK